MDQSLALCRSLLEEGIGCVVATPHQLGRFDGSNDAANVRETVSQLNGRLTDAGIALKVVPGGEVRVDERICELLKADKVLTIADAGRYILLELPHDVFIDIEPLLRDLDSMGVRAILSHPEKSASLLGNQQVLRGWLDRGVRLQVTASSLAGALGPQIEKVAWGLLGSGWANIVATDAHDVGLKRPEMRAAFKRISTRLGVKVATLFCIDNPSRVVAGQDVVAYRQEVHR
ncbi:MAG: hypothetical protein JSU70_16805 [Phycisphaerales bacterium]|nr:MAG: hypothetical protein JSU70_16805 [Phycisphaerales bacterium]